MTQTLDVGLPQAPDSSRVDSADGVREAVLDTCRRAREASRVLRRTTTGTKDALLRAMADDLVSATDTLVAANASDMGRGARDRMTPALLDRLRLDADRVLCVAEALRALASLPDPVGVVALGRTLPNGLQVRQVRVPLGVVAMVYEARPNVTVDAAGLALKSGNAVVLRGGSAAAETNRALIGVLRATLRRHELPEDAVTSIDEHGRDGVAHLMRARGLVDVLVPRGGAELIAAVVEGSTVPVIETGVGNCHVYVDASADLASAVAIIRNAKVQRPSVCNAAETLLVHADAAKAFLALVLPALHADGVRVHADPRAAEAAATAGVPWTPADDDDWAREYLDLDLAVGVVDDIDAALSHIRRWSTGHTEAIVTRDRSAARRFVAEVDSAAVMVNASTRFTDGAELGLGAEVGISTQKLHARGPMGLAELTTTTWVVEGDGQVRA